MLFQMTKGVKYRSPLPISLVMTKTAQFLLVLHHVATSPNRCLPEERLRSLLGDPPKSTWHRLINELTVGASDVPAVLMRTIQKDTEGVFYCVNHRGWQAFLDAHEEGKFLLECYRQVGHLLDSDFTFSAQLIESPA